MPKRLAALLALYVLCSLLLIAGEKVDSDVNWKIRREATENSQVLSLVHQLTDVYGPRLTGSPNFEAACNWSITEMQRWGMQNGHLEKWDFEHPGWYCDRYSVRVLSPYKDTLDARVIAWTPSTKGIVRAVIVQITPPDRPSQEELTSFLASVKDVVKDRIVLVGAHKKVRIQFNPSNKRREDSDLIAQYDPKNPAPAVQPKTPPISENEPKPLEPREVEHKIDAFLLENGALVKVIDAARDHGQISVFANRTFNAARAIPGIVVRNEDYGRLSRTLADGESVEMEIDLQNTIYPDEQYSFNAIAEIPGTDKRDQVVMMGAHIDSWHAGTGATDNASGVAVMMEAARILQKLNVRPRRTIRVALWGGEEQGLLGSKAYVSEHYGTFESPKQEYSSLSAYLNLDSGTGRVRGASVFGPPEAADVLRAVLAAFSDMGVIGANWVKTRAYGGTDSTSFSWAGLPGINFSQDPIEYFSDTWHTDLDTYESVLETDLKQCAAVVAATAYHLAMREEVLPRFPGDSMPKPEK
jgi:carboxypeptidase Q